MNEKQLREHLQALHMPALGIAYVIQAATTDPAKTVFHGNRQSVAGEYHSSIPTCLDDAPRHWRLQFTARSTEYAFIVDLESRGHAMLVLDQPSSVNLDIINTRGRRQRITYTADFLVVEGDRVRVVECKTREDALKLVKDKPGCWCEDGGRFVYTQARDFFAQMGMVHEVILSDQLPWLRVQNHLLMQACDRALGTIDLADVLVSIARYVRQHEPCSIDQIRRDLQLLTAGPILRAIQDQIVHVALDQVQLTDSHSHFICASAASATAVALGLSSIQALARTDQSVSFDQVCDPSHVGEFGYRLARLQGQALTRPGDKKDPSPRTLRRWRKTAREAGSSALRPRWSQCGTRGMRLSTWHAELVIEQIAQGKSSITRPTRRKTHGNYEKLVEAHCLAHDVKARPLSYSQFCEIWAQRKHQYSDAMALGGLRLANAVAPHKDVDQQLPMASRPFQVASIDHCLAPSLAECDVSGEQGLPWVTILLDAFESEPLAFVLRFEAPSFVSDALVLRDCVKRHGRLPAALYTDGGSDFTSGKLAHCLAELEMSWFKRPVADPRSSAAVERTFLTFATTVCQGCDGFMPDILNRRSVSRDKLPANGPRRVFQQLYDHTEHLLLNVLPHLPRLDATPTAAERRAEFEATYGVQGLPQTVDLPFLIKTAVPLASTGKSCPSGAIRVNNRRFYSTTLNGKTLRLSKLNLRQDPQDASVVYFAYEGSWHVAKSRRALDNRGREDSAIAYSPPPVDQEKVKKQRNQMLHGYAPTPPPEQSGAQPPATPPVASDTDMASSPPPDAGIRLDQIPTMGSIHTLLQKKWGGA